MNADTRNARLISSGWFAESRGMNYHAHRHHCCQMPPLSQTGRMEDVDYVEADLGREEHQRAVLDLVNAYSCDAMGDGKPLSPDARARLIAGLQAHPTTLIFLAFKAREPVGVAVCFRGFSTFAARPLLNIHDLNVLPAYRGVGIGRGLIAAVEAKARELGCCKLSLEVQEKNERARRTYAAAGFAQAQYEPEAGNVLFLTKRL